MTDATTYEKATDADAGPIAVEDDGPSARFALSEIVRESVAFEELPEYHVYAEVLESSADSAEAAMEN